MSDEMTEIEKAAEWFENRARATPMPGACRMFELAAESLREKANGVTVQEWISVDDPPKTYRDENGELIPFLVCCKGTVYPFRALYDGKNWGDGIGVLKVTHWMPLPEPPKMKGGE